MSITIPEAIWGKEIAFKTQASVDAVQRLIKLQEKVINYLKTNELVSISNQEIAKIQQAIHAEKQQNLEPYFNFFIVNCEGFILELSHNLNYQDDLSFTQIMGERWLSIKRYLFWMGFFFKCCVDLKESYKLYTKAFEIIKNQFFLQHKDQILKSIINLTNIERHQYLEQNANQNIEYLIQMFFVCSFDKVILMKEMEIPLFDPLVYKPAPSLDPKKVASNQNAEKNQITVSKQFYIDQFENPFKDQLLNVYSQFFNQWCSLNTSEYVQISLKTLENEDKILERYCPQSKRFFLDAIEEVIIVKHAINLAHDQKFGFLSMIEQKKYDQISQLHKLFRRVPVKVVKKEEEKKEEKKEDKKDSKKDSKKEDKKKEEKKEKAEEKNDDKTPNKTPDDKQKQAEVDKKNEEEKNNKQQQQQIIRHPIDEMCDIFQEFINKKGQLINNDQEISKTALKYFQCVIELKEEVDKILNIFLKNDLALVKSKEIGFKLFLNNFDNAPIYLNQFCDNFLNKDTGKSYSEDDINKLMAHISSIVYFISAKDKFFQYYEKFLCVRILQNKVSSDEYEKRMISNFKKDYGSSIMKKCEQMMLDISLQEDLNKDFQKYRESQQITFPIKQFTVYVLQQSSWPISTGKQNQKQNIQQGKAEQQYNGIAIPEIMSQCTSLFQDYYYKSNKAKMLDWSLTEGEAEVHYNKYQFVVSTYQLIIILQFNVQNEWSFGDLKKMTNLSDKEIERILRIYHKVKLLGIKPALVEGQTLSDSHKIGLNEKFENQRKKLILNVRKVHEEASAQASATEDLDKIRQAQLDATIVRIMKSRRILEYNELTADVFKLTTLFKPEPRLIKKQIDSLIERDYMKRDEKKRALLIYVP